MFEEIRSHIEELSELLTQIKEENKFFFDEDVDMTMLELWYKTIKKLETMIDQYYKFESGIIGSLDEIYNGLLDIELGGSVEGGETVADTLVTISNGTLTKDKYQYINITSAISFTLPSVSDYTEIHLFFNGTTNAITLPSIKWQTEPTIETGKVYELIFTYANEWLGGVIVYE